MFEKLLSLLLHAKAGAISGVFLLGATGALVSVSASNGVTTITVTPSASPNAAAQVEATKHSSSPSPKVARAPLAPTTADTCSAEATALSFQVQRVDAAFNGFHTKLEALRKDHDKAALETSDKALKQIRQSAVKAIHATRTCTHEDNDADESHNATTGTTSVNDDEDTDEDTDEDNDEDKDEDNDTSTSTSTLTFTGTAASIANQAILAMQAAFDTASKAPAKAAKPESTHQTESTRGQTGTKGSEHKGEGEHHD